MAELIIFFFMTNRLLDINGIETLVISDDAYVIYDVLVTVISDLHVNVLI